MNEHPLHEPGAAPSPRKKSWFRTFLCAIFLWMPLTLAGGNLLFGITGVCLSQMRKWSHDELIEVVVRSLAMSEYGHVDDDGIRRVRREMAIENTDSAIRKLLKDNPRCCEVVPYSDLLDLLTGFHMVQVVVNYERNPDRSRGEEGPYYQQNILVNTCGEVIKNLWGDSHDTLQTTNHIYK